LSCENSNKNNTKKEQRQKQEAATAATKTSATLLHFWRALQFKIAVSQSVMK